MTVFPTLPEKIDVVCNIDNHYTLYCGVMLTSLFENNPETIFCVHVITDYLTPENRTKLANLITGRNNEVFFYKADPALFSECPIGESKHITLATYYRLLIPDLLPSALDKVLYLDCDMIIQSSVRELWETDIEGKALAALEDAPHAAATAAARLHYPSSYSYFNAGLMLINLAYWRKHRVSARAFEYIKEHPQDLLFHDQDVLNYLLHGKAIFISPRWNLMDCFLTPEPQIQPERREALKDAVLSPCIIHFTGNKKPWNPKCENPYKNEYDRYLKLTGWNISTALPLKYKIRSGFRELLYRSGIKKRKFIRLPKENRK